MATEDILKDVNLRYSSDKKPGYSRRIIGDKFVYFNTDGKKITDQSTIDRINKLVIPFPTLFFIILFIFWLLLVNVKHLITHFVFVKEINYFLPVVKRCYECAFRHSCTAQFPQQAL